MPHFVDGEAVPGLPGFGRNAGKGVFGGQRRIGLDKGVDAGSVGVQHRAGARAGGGVVGIGGIREAQAAQLHILPDGGLADHFSPATDGAAAVVFHRPEPILRRNETLSKPGVRLVGGLDMGYAPFIPPDRDGGAQAGQVDCAVQRGDGGGQVGCGDGG